MQQQWQAFLAKQGATIESNLVSHFDSIEKEVEYSNTTTVLCDLSHYTLIQVSGSDANSFLQAQLSNDINHVTDNATQLSAYCSPKGRALALFHIFKLDNTYFLSLPSEVADKTITRLKMFIMRSDVTMDDVTDEYFHFGVTGKDAANSIKTDLAVSSFAENPTEACISNGISIQKLSGNHERFELFGPIGEAITIWSKLQQNCHPVGRSAWNLQRINAGIPEVLANTSDVFVPQMLNLQLLNAVNFQKGCYPGQEIVARTKYLGKLKKRLYLIEIETNNSVDIGTDIYENGENQQSVGKIVLAEPNSEISYHALAVLRIAALDNQPLSLVDKSGPILKLLENPYNLDEDNA